MAFYLGIYSKKRFVNESSIMPAVEDFSSNGSRSIYALKRPGFHLYIVEKFKDQLVDGDNGIGFMAGWLHHPESILKNDSDHYSGIFENLHLGEISPFFADSEGAFALAYYNAKNHTLILAKDKFGIYPMFIYEDEEYIVFSNEYEPLAEMQGGKIINPDAIAEYFVLGASLEGKTFLKNINNLPPATACIIKDDVIEYAEYWKFELKIDERNVEILAKETWDLFESVNRQVFDYQKIEIVLLSAGADSRLILATLSPFQYQSVRFYTSNLSHLSPDEDQDVVGATLLVKKFGLKHIVEKISYSENEFGGNYFSNWREIRLHQVYGGWHGGEFLGGFSLNAAPVSADLAKEDVQKRFYSLFSRKFRKKVKINPWDSYLKSKDAGVIYFFRQFFQSFFTSIYGGARGHWLQPYQLANHGYSPFWDSRVISKILSVPPHLLNSYEFYNEVIKNAPEDFRRIGSNSPMTKRIDTNLAPLTTGIEPKHQMPDVHTKAFEKYIKEKSTWKKKFYRRKYLKNILANKKDSISIRWLDFEVWYNEYMRF